MAIYDDVLQVLPKFEADAVSAKDLFEICPGAESVVEVSTALSQLFSTGRIKRKDAVFGKSRFAYWCDDPNVASSPAGAAAPKQASDDFSAKKVIDAAPVVSAPAPVAEKPLPSSIGGMVAAIEDKIDSFLGGPVEPDPVPAVPAAAFTVNIQMQVDLPDMPTTLKLSRVKKPGDISVGDGVVYMDVSELDDDAVDMISYQWAERFRAHVQERRRLAA